MRWSMQCSAGVAIALTALAVIHMPGPTALAETATVPKDFKVRLTSASLGPPRDPPDIQWVEIEASGAARLSEYRRGGKALPATTLKLASKAVAQIYQAIVQQKFFGLKPEYRDPNVRGGDQAIMRVTANGKMHTVRAANIRVNALDAIAGVINASLPADRAIRYNALHVKSYMTVDR